MVALDLPDRLQPVFLRLFRDELNVEESALVGTECVVSCCGATDNARADIGDDILVEAVCLGDNKAPSVLKRAPA